MLYFLVHLLSIYNLCCLSFENKSFNFFFIKIVFLVPETAKFTWSFLLKCNGFIQNKGQINKTFTCLTCTRSETMEEKRRKIEWKRTGTDDPSLGTRKSFPLSLHTSGNNLVFSVGNSQVQMRLKWASKCNRRLVLWGN